MADQSKAALKIIERAENSLKKLGVKHLISAFTEKDIIVAADLKGADIQVLLSAILTKREDIVNLGIWVGGILSNRQSDDDSNNETI